jgi:hypothetical protein
MKYGRHTLNTLDLMRVHNVFVLSQDGPLYFIQSRPFFCEYKLNTRRVDQGFHKNMQSHSEKMVPKNAPKDS